MSDGGACVDGVVVVLLVVILSFFLLLLARIFLARRGEKAWTKANAFGRSLKLASVPGRIL